MKKISMFRLAASALCLLLAAALGPAALADTIWEPQNSFYEAHREACTYVNRIYLANGPEGYLVLTASPESATVTAAFENGQALNVLFTYEGASRTWGVADFRPEGSEEWVSGWFPMDEVLLRYDSIAFQADHAGELNPCDAGILDYAAPGTSVVLWRYPGGPAESDPLVPTDSMRFDQSWTDGEGRLWGHGTYYQGWKDFWVCLSDPGSSDLPVAEISYDGLIPPAAPPENPRPTAPEPSPFPTLAAGLVAGVVLVSAALLIFFRRRSTGKGGQS